MAFEVAEQNTVLAATSLGIALMEADAALENAIEETNLFIEEAQFKVMTENGTDDDMNYYREAASNGFIATAKEVVIKIVDALKTFFSELKEKVIKLFAAKDIDANLEKVEKKIKMNPILKNKKIKINDGDAQKEAIKEHKENLSKLLAKCTSGENVTTDDVEKEEERFNKAWIAAAGATVTLAFGAVIAAVKKARADLGKAIGDAEDDIMDRIKSAQKKVNKIADPEKAATLTKLCQSAAKAAKKEGETILGTMLDMWKAVKNAVSRSRDADDDVFDESTNPYEGLDLDDDVDEGNIDDFIAALNDLSEEEYPVDDVPPEEADVEVPVYAGEVDIDDSLSESSKGISGNIASRGSGNLTNYKFYRDGKPVSDEEQNKKNAAMSTAIRNLAKSGDASRIKMSDLDKESSDDVPADDMDDIDEVDPKQKKEYEKEFADASKNESADDTHVDSSSEDETLESVSAELDDLFSGLHEFYSESSTVAEQTCCECGEPIAEGTECHVTESGGVICEACWKKDKS